MGLVAILFVLGALSLYILNCINPPRPVQPKVDISTPEKHIKKRRRKNKKQKNLIKEYNRKLKKSNTQNKKHVQKEGNQHPKSAQNNKEHVQKEGNQHPKFAQNKKHVQKEANQHPKSAQSSAYKLVTKPKSSIRLESHNSKSISLVQNPISVNSKSSNSKSQGIVKKIKQKPISKKTLTGNDTPKKLKNMTTKANINLNNLVEIIGKKRIPIGTKIQIEWNGHPFNATVVGESTGNFPHLIQWGTKTINMRINVDLMRVITAKNKDGFPFRFMEKASQLPEVSKSDVIEAPPLVKWVNDNKKIVDVQEYIVEKKNIQSNNHKNNSSPRWSIGDKCHAKWPKDDHAFYYVAIIKDVTTRGYIIEYIDYAGSRCEVPESYLKPIAVEPTKTWGNSKKEHSGAPLNVSSVSSDNEGWEIVSHNKQRNSPKKPIILDLSASTPKTLTKPIRAKVPKWTIEEKKNKEKNKAKNARRRRKKNMLLEARREMLQRRNASQRETE